MSEKVKLPKRVAEAIDGAWNLYDNNASPRHVVLTNWRFMDDFAAEYKHMLMSFYKNNPIEYVQALVNGYEVEETPEDRIRETYKRLMNLAKVEIGDKNGAFFGQMTGILHALNELNIKIEGVNAE